MKRHRSNRKLDSLEIPRMEDLFDMAPEEQARVLRSLLCTIRHFFGDFASLFSSVTDPRNPRKTLYPLGGLAFAAVMMYLCHLKARRQIGLLLRTAAAMETFAALFKVASVPHGDTVNDGFCGMEPEQIQSVLCSMIAMLIRKKVLYPHRVLGKYFAIAGDGTGTLSYSRRHCPHCLTQTQKGKTTFSHKVFEAKLVTLNGFAFSMMTEFIENPGENPKKQDCELKAFYRLAPRLKQAFPRLPVILTLDSLFARGPVFDLCGSLDWKFMIVLKNRSLPSVHRQFEALWQLHRENRLTWRSGDKSEITREFRWANGIVYTDSKKRRHTLNVLECIETKPNKKGGPKSTTFKWVTNHPITDRNVMALANEAGRPRWNIENRGFNVQKNGGYELEHAYTADPVSAKVFYYLLQIAHMIAQLLYYGSLIGRAGRRKIGSAKNLAFLILEAWRHSRLTNIALEALSRERSRITFCPDTS